MTLDRTAAGWVLIDARRNLARFDRYGRLVSVSDSVKDSEDTGNEMLFAYDPASRLVRITDTLDRKIASSTTPRGVSRASRISTTARCATNTTPPAV